MCQDTESVARTGRNNLIVKRDGSQAPTRSHRGHTREGVTEWRGGSSSSRPLLTATEARVFKIPEKCLFAEPLPPLGQVKRG